MASMSIRSSLTQSLINPRRRSGHRKSPIHISPAMKSPQIRSILSLHNLNQKSPISSHNLDDWVQETAAEIVRNLRRAPLLVQVHDDGRVEMDAAEKEDWEAVATRWRDGGAPAPDGVMLVEEIREKEEEEERETRIWGIVVQGKGSGRVTGYLLKTCRVGSGCTHFCLTRVRDFSESALSQLNSCWLLN